jgi:hypothetical protein
MDLAVILQNSQPALWLVCAIHLITSAEEVFGAEKVPSNSTVIGLQ